MQKSWAKLYSLLVVLFICVSFISPISAKDNIGPLHGPSVVNSEPGGVFEQVLMVYNKYITENGNSFSTSSKLSKGELDKALDLMKELYITADKTGDAHGTIALLIKKGLPEESLSEAFKGDHTKISEDASKFMAQAREQLIEETLLKVLAEPEKVTSGGTESGKAGKLHVARSDTGNPASGMRSDLDQTFFVYKVDPQTGAKIRAPELDQAFLNRFEAEWNTKTDGLTLKMLDVVSIKGSARFPDPRYVSFDDFTGAFHRTAGELRNLEGAYISPDAITQQVHKRQYEVLSQLTEAAKPIDPNNPPRVWQEYGTGPNGGEPGKMTSPDYDYAVREMLGGAPELTPQAGFSAAIANWMMLQHSFEGNAFNVKYHLRTFDDAIYVQILQEQGGRMNQKSEYSKMTPEQRDLIAKEAMERLFPDDVEKQKHHKAAMDISAEMRNRHTGDNGGKSGVADQDIYKPLLEELYNEKFQPGDTSDIGKKRLVAQIDAAKAYHKELASEFCIKSAQQTAPNAFEAMKGGSIIEDVRPLFEVEGRNWDETRGNLMEGARLTLLYGIYDLGPTEGLKLMEKLNVDIDSASRWDLATLYLEAQFLPFKAYYHNPDAYNRVIQARVTDLAEGVHHHALSEWGFKNVEEFDAAGALLTNQKMVWSGRKLFKNMFYDMGSVASVAQIAEVFVTSKGDWDKVLAKAMDEVLLTVPIVGQLENLRRGGVEGALLLGPILYFPPLGKVMVAYNIAKSIHIITDVEYLKPRRNNAADLIYRGFAGPETRAFGEPGAPPPIWTDAMEKEYENKKAWVHHLSTTLSMLETPNPYRVQDPAATVEGTKKALNDATAEFQQIETLRNHWHDFRDGNWSGGYWSGGGAVLEQTWMEGSLLKEMKIKPEIAFLSSGVVDLGIDWDPEKSPVLLEKYEDEEKNGKTIEIQLRAKAQIVNLKNREKNWTRANRYKEKITLNGSQQIKENKEMRVRFLRDSIYANIQKRKMRMDSWVDNYFKRNEKRIYNRLFQEGLIEPVKIIRRFGKDYMPIPEDQIVYIPYEIRKLVRDRLQQDYERSRRLLAAYKTNLNHVEKEQERIVKEQILKYQNQGFSQVKNELMEKEDFKQFLNALRFSYVKRKAPRVKMTFFKTLSNNKEIKNGKSGALILEPCQLDLQVNVQVDPSIYYPGYRTRLVELNADQMTSPPDSLSGVPLLPETIKQIKTLARKNKASIDKGKMFIAVGTVSSKGVNQMTGAAMKTVEGLPGYESGTAAKGEVILSQQIQAIETTPFSVNIDPIHIEVVDAADQLISDDNCRLTIGDKTFKTAGGKYDLIHRFTTYDEEIEIVATYSLSQEDVITGAAKVSINDIESWIEPSFPEIIKIKLPILMPGSVGVKGQIKLNKLPNSGGVNDRAILKSGSLGISALIGIPGEKPGADGRFEFNSRKPIKTGESINIIGQTSGHIEKKLPGNKIEKITVSYAGTKTIAVPQIGGMIDLGEITMNGKAKLVMVPEFDRTKPMPYKTYAMLVEQAGLKPKPTTVKPHDDPKFSHSVKNTTPQAGSMVPPGSDVAVEIYGDSDRLVPDVVTLHIEAAIEMLKKKDIIVKHKITKMPPRPNKELTIINQSVEPGATYKSGLELHVEIYGRAADMVIAVPDLKDMTITKAVEEIQTQGLTLHRDPSNKPAPDLRHEGLIYQQKPKPGEQINPSQRVTVWVYGKKSSGGEADGIGEVTGPYYVVFGLTSQVPEKSAGKVKFPKKRENESDESFKGRIRSFVNSIPFNQLKLQPIPAEKMVLPFHISGAGLQRYPRKMFLPGSKAAAKIYFKNGKAKPGDLSVLKGTLLLNVLGLYGSKEEVIENYPKAKETKQFSSLTLNNTAGTARIQQEGNDITLGPITPGWTQNDLKDSWNFWKELYIALGQLSCFVSTISYPDQNDPYFVSLRQFRDQVLMQTDSGKQLVDLYYRHGPALAAFVVSHDLQPYSRRVLNFIATMLESENKGGVIHRTLMNAAIKTAGNVIPRLAPFFIESTPSSGIQLDPDLPQSMAIDLLKRNPYGKRNGLD